MARELVDINAHEHDWDGRRMPHSGTWVDCGDHWEQAWWATVHCTCGVNMGEFDHEIRTKPKQ